MSKILALAILSLIYSSAYGQAMLTFAGGSGQSLSVRLDAPVSYLVTTSSQGNTPIFNFQGVGNLFANRPARVTGSIAFTIDGGSPFSIQYLSSGYIGGDVQATDLFATGPSLGSALSVNAGQTVTLLPGTSFTVTGFTVTAPPSGSYATFLSAGQGTAISGFGMAVPEPGTCVTVLGGLYFLARRPRRAITESHPKSSCLMLC